MYDDSFRFLGYVSSRKHFLVIMYSIREGTFEADRLRSDDTTMFNSIRLLVERIRDKRKLFCLSRLIELPVRSSDREVRVYPLEVFNPI